MSGLALKTLKTLKTLKVLKVLKVRSTRSESQKAKVRWSEGHKRESDLGWTGSSLLEREVCTGKTFLGPTDLI